MMTSLADSEKVKLDEINQVVAELCCKAPSTQVKECLQSYQYGKSLKQLKSALMTNTNKVLTDTFTHIVPPNTFIPKTKESLSHSIICKVQNYLSDQCEYCKCSYRFKFGDVPLLECKVCGQEVHRSCFLQAINEPSDSTISADAVLLKMNPLKIANLHYICKHCEGKVIPDAAVNKTGVKKADVIGDNLNGSTHSNASDINDTADDTVDAVIEDVTPLTTVTTDAPQNQENNNQTRQRERTASVDDNETNPQKSNVVCTFYEKGKCKHGRKGKNCKFLHPKMCRKLLEHGTKKKRGCTRNDCPDHHPPMCETSLKNGTCFKSACKRRHVRNTVFKKAPHASHNAGAEVKQACNEVTPTENTVLKDFLEQALAQFKVDIFKEMETKMQTAFIPFRQMQTNQWQLPPPQMGFYPRLMNPVR